MVGIKHILTTPFHLQTNGRLERYHQALKRDVNQVPYESPADLEAAIAAFVSYRPLPQGPGQRDTLRRAQGKVAGILRRRKVVQAQTIER